LLCAHTKILDWSHFILHGACCAFPSCRMHSEGVMFHCAGFPLDTTTQHPPLRSRTRRNSSLRFYFSPNPFARIAASPISMGASSIGSRFRRAWEEKSLPCGACFFSKMRFRRIIHFYLQRSDVWAIARRYEGSYSFSFYACAVC
jgi:hypothetical protein